MSAIEIFTDGSYINKNVGVGCVRVVPKSDDHEYGLVATSCAYRIKGIAHYGSQAAEAMAVIHALDELQKIDYTDDVIIYCDLDDLNNYINGYEYTVDESIENIFDELDNALARHTSVRALHPKHAAHLSQYLHAIAHNASAVESGSQKKEYTGPDYRGKYEHRSAPNPHLKRKITIPPVGQSDNGMAIIDDDRKMNYPISDPRHPKFKF